MLTHKQAVYRLLAYLQAGLRATRDLLEAIRCDELSLRAMALTYSTITSTIPLLAVLVAVMKAFGMHQRLDSVLAFGLEPLGPDAALVAERILSVIDQLNLSALGAIGLAGFLYTTVALVGQLEDSMNVIWTVEQARNWREKFSDYLSVVLTGPVLIGAALGIATSLPAHLLAEVPAALLPEFVFFAAARVLPVLLMASAFAFLYKLLPNTGVRWLPALTGGLIAGMLWQVASHLFAFFVTSSTRYALVYSGFAVAIITLLWLYVGWFILLIGTELAQFCQYWPQAKAWPRWKAVHALHERLGLSLLVAIAEHHLHGLPPLTCMAYARRFDVPLAHVEAVARQLLAHKLLLQTHAPAGLVLARSADKLSLNDILAFLDGRLEADFQSIPEVQPGVQQLLAQRNRQAEHLLQGLSLRDLVDQKTAPPLHGRMRATASTPIYPPSPVAGEATANNDKTTRAHLQ
jgi:membrane protein